MTAMVDERPAGTLEYRAAKLNDVKYADRIVQLIVMPYNERAMVEHHGRMITESVAPGSFKGIQRRLSSGPGIKANRNHDIDKIVGRVTGVYPDREEGLVADIRISNTELGNETLTLADDGLLDASAGFMPLEGGEQWPNRNERRLTRVYLGHVSFVGEPAFEGAKVLSVRASGDPASATPNADEVRAWMLAEQYARLPGSH